VQTKGGLYVVDTQHKIKLAAAKTRFSKSMYGGRFIWLRESARVRESLEVFLFIYLSLSISIYKDIIIRIDKKKALYESMT
jgi:hypothetical protein